MSVLNSGQGFLSANIGPGAQYNNNAAGMQVNHNYYPATPAIDRGPPKSEKELKEECLQTLIFSTIHARRHDIDVAYPSTGDWIFKTPDFRQWRDRTNLSRHNGVLWIKGHPGSGKSTLMKHIWSHCQQELKDRTIAAYFFHARGDSLEKTPLGMLRSLVYQLLNKDEAMWQRFLPLFHETYPVREKKVEWRESELKNFLLSEMRVEQRKPIVLLVDALDECSDSQVRNVVKFLEQLSITCLRHGVNVCICLSSRHYPHITMAKYQEFVVETMKGHDADIATYVHGNLTRPDPNIENGVLEKASGIFLWVVLVVAMLNKANDEGKVEAMEQKLREVPSDLGELFSTILSKDNPDKHETILMLQWVLFAVRPLAPEELYYATLAGTGVTNLRPWDQSQLTADNIQRRITYSSKGLIEVPKAKRTVQFIHESVKDFLLRNQRLQSLDPTLGLNPIGQSHDRLKTCCVSFIRINAPMLNDNLEDEISMDPEDLDSKYPFFKYASLVWLDHAEAAEAGNVSQENFLRGIKEDHVMEQLLWAHTRHCDNRLRGERGNDIDLLYIFLAHAHNNVARILLEHGADISPQGWNYGLALHAAVSNGPKEMSEMVRLLIRYGANPNYRHEGSTPLHDAISYGNVESVRVLLENGADVNALNSNSETALHLILGSDSVAIRSEVNDVMKLLLKHGADVNARHRRRAGTVLQDAAHYGDDEIVEMLLEHDADVNAPGGEYGTALQAASLKNNRDIAVLLLEHGANINAIGGKYGTALQAAVASPYYHSFRDWSRNLRNVTTLLLDHGANVNAQGGRYGTALQVAISRGHKDIEWLLREHGATE